MALVALAVVARAHGVRGELRVRLYNPGSDLLFAAESLTLRQGTVERVVVLEAARPCAERSEYLVRLAGVDDRDAAERLRGAELCVPRAALPDPAPGEVYEVDLVGLRVETAGGAVVGRVEEVLDYPASTCLRVETPGGTLEVPVREPYVVRVELAAGRVVVGDLADLPVEAPRRARRGP